MLSTNVLIIGKSGVGKSSLLNYIFDREIQKTGSGAPVTEEGIYSFDYQYDEDFLIRIYDTWGLEPNKFERWQKLILDEIANHDKRSINEWFNTIIFCISANTSRVEEFELEIIKSLRRGMNNLVVAITHSKNEEDANALAIKDRIIKETVMNPEDIILVNNIEKKLIGRTTKKFGKEKVISSIIKNLWNQLKYKVPFMVKKFLDETYENEYHAMHEYIDKQKLLFKRKKKLEEFEEDINSEFSDFLEETVVKINRYFIEAMEYYNSLTKKYLEAFALLDKKDIILETDERFLVEQSFTKEVDSVINDAKSKIREIGILANQDINMEVIRKISVAILKYLATDKVVKNDIKKALDNHLEKSKEVMIVQIERIENVILLITV